MQVVDCATMRAWDRRAIEEWGLPGIVLMENAGRGAVDVLVSLGIHGPVTILCGPGNNGGDGFVMARHLVLRGFTVRVLLLAPPARYRGDALINLQVIQRTGVVWHEYGDPATDAWWQTSDWIVDGLLGTGSQGAPRGALAEAIQRMNAGPGRRFAVDLPSGLDGDTGVAADPTVVAQATCTLAAAKPGLLNPAAAHYVGQLFVADIGVRLSNCNGFT